LVGLGLGVGVSNACGGDVSTVWPAWAALSATHLTCTWLSLRYVADVELGAHLRDVRARVAGPRREA